MAIKEKELIKIAAKEILLFLADANVFAFQNFDRHGFYRKSINSYWSWRDINHNSFSRTIYRLKQAKLIKNYKDGKEKYLELTPKGLEKVKHYSLDNIEIQAPKVWDRKWRIVIFDIPDDKKVARNILRDKLRQIGFILLQESVFIFPFECKREIDYIVNNFFIKPYVKYILADIIEGDDDLIKKFLDSGTLELKMLK